MELFHVSEDKRVPHRLLMPFLYYVIAKELAERLSLLLQPPPEHLTS